MNMRALILAVSFLTTAALIIGVLTNHLIEAVIASLIVDAVMFALLLAKSKRR